MPLMLRWQQRLAEDENSKVRRTVASGFHEVRREGGREGGRDGEGREEEKRKRKGKERGRKEEGERERREPCSFEVDKRGNRC